MRQIVLLLGLLCLAAAGPTPGSKNVHDLMTDEELMQVFQTERHAVPEYEVIPVHWPKKSKRSSGSSTPLKLKAFGTSIKLWLHPTDDVLVGRNTPVFVAKSDAGRFQMYRVKDPMTRVGEMLEDREKQATLMVKKTEQGSNTITGSVGEQGWNVKPLPNHINQNYGDRLTSSLNDINHIEYNEPHYHVIYKQPEQNRTADYAFRPMKEGLLDEQFNRTKRTAVPEVIYPQVLIFADVETYRLHDENLSKFLEYLLPFWNGVDLRYRSLDHPKVRFNIAGIIIGMDHDVFPFISRHVSLPNTLYFDDVPTELSKFLTKETSFNKILPSESYDIAIAMVPYKLCSEIDGTCNTLGLAFVGGACTTHKTGVILDNGNFNGIYTAVHEVGHLFGVNHDSQLNSAACADEGYIMSSRTRKTKNIADWSLCSVQSMRKFFSGNTQKYLTPDCLYNKPNTISPLPRVLPGSIMTMDEQCMKQFGTRYCDIGLTEKQICLSLRCFESNSTNTCKTAMSPVDGTICGENKICLNAKCVNQSLIL